MHKTIVLLVLLFSILSNLPAQEPITAKLAPSENKNVTQPEFPGGENNFYKYLSDNIKYPPVLIKIKLEGSISLKFIVDKEGKIKNVEITTGFDPDADDEVLRVIRTMPTWTPAKENGEVVDFIHHLTVTFTLTDELIEQAKNPIKKPEVDTKTTEQVPIPEQNTDTEIKVDSLNRDPQYPGGQEAMEAYFKKNMKYPKRALEHRIEGRVVFNLEISPEGKITKIWIFKGLFYECDEEAYFLIKKMPDWIPGLKDGKPATMRVIVPVPFVLPQ